MLGSSKPIPFDPYGRRRSRRAIPRWLVLMLLGIGLGATGVIYVQERHLPPRLGAEASARLRQSFERADAERQRLQAELAAASDRLRGTLDENKRLATGCGRARRDRAAAATGHRALVAALPADPRNGRSRCAPPASRCRATRWPTTSCCRATTPARHPFGGVMQLVLAGASGRADDTVAPGSGADLGRALRHGARQLPLPRASSRARRRSTCSTRSAASSWGCA